MRLLRKLCFLLPFTPTCYRHIAIGMEEVCTRYGGDTHQARTFYEPGVGLV
jgi:hypothetical protein